MANLIIQENGIERTTPALHGEEITIQTPCDCSAVTGVKIAGVVYPFYDAAGKVLPSGTGLFTNDSLIRVLIDTVNTRATIINHAITPASIGATPVSHTADKNNPHGVTYDQTGAAAASHNHDASEIISGTLSVSRGGTGRSALTSGSFLKGNAQGAVTMRTPAEVLSDIGAAASGHTHSASEVGAAAASHTHVFSSEITGTVSASRGGTGRDKLTSGSYLVGNGTSAVTLKTPSAVLTDIGAASYEEGTWTPTDVNSCGLSFSSATILYTKIGRFVHVLLKLKTASSTKGKAITIGGLPFAPNCTYPSSVGLWANQEASGATTKQGIVATGAASVSPAYCVELKNADGSAVTDSSLGANVQLTMSLYYQVK